MSNDEEQSGRRWLLALCCAVCFLCFVASYMRMPLFPLYAASLGVGEVAVGLLSAVYLALAGVLAIPAGMLSDRIGRRTPVIVGLSLLSLSSLLLWKSSRPCDLLIVCTLSGVGTALFAPPLMSYVADLTPPKRLGSAFGMYTTALYAGMTFGPALGGVSGKAFGYRPVFLATGLILLLLSLTVLAFLPAGRRRETHGAGRLPGGLGEVVANRPLMVCLVTMFANWIGYGMFITFMPLYARTFGLDSAHVGFIFAAQALGNAGSRVPFGRLGDRMSDRSPLVVVGLAGFICAVFGFGYAHTFITFLACSTLFGVSMGIAFTALMALTVDAVQKRSRGLAMGLYNSCLYLGMMFSSATMGVVIRNFGYKSAFVACGAAGIAGLLLFYFRYSRVSALPDEEGELPQGAAAD